MSVVPEFNLNGTKYDQVFKTFCCCCSCKTAIYILKFPNWKYLLEINLICNKMKLHGIVCGIKI